MSKGDSRLSSNSFSETAHPLLGEAGGGERGMRASLPQHRSAAPSPLPCASGTGSGSVKELRKITDV